MTALNQYALSKALGSRIKPVQRAQFGGFGLLRTTAEALKARHAFEKHGETASFGYEQDRLVVKAFEEVRDGAAPDAILWDRRLLDAFLARCEQLGLPTEGGVCGRRLINVRKNKQRYEKHGIRITPATKSEPHASIVPRYAHVIEFALVRLRYRYGASIDEILLDPELGSLFEELSLSVAPELSVTDVRLGALDIRKSRFLPSSATERNAICSLEPALIESAWSGTTLDQIDVAQVPKTAGLIELDEPGRCLYVSRNSDLRAIVQQLCSGEAFQVVANQFWEPDLRTITVHFVAGETVAGAGASRWERRLICDRNPLFNWPIRKAAA